MEPVGRQEGGRTVHLRAAANLPSLPPLPRHRAIHQAQEPGRQESSCLAGNTSVIITVITVITVITASFTVTSPQLLVIVSDGRGIFHEGREKVTQAVMKARQVTDTLHLNIVML